MTKPQQIRLSYEPREWQRQCHEQRERFTVLVLHRRAGKTTLAVMQLLDDALRCDRELALFAYIAPFRNQAKSIAWELLKKKVEKLRVAGAVEVYEADLAVRFLHNGATVRLFGADNSDALRGLRLDGAVLDEVAQVAPSVWHDVVQPALSDRQGWALFIGTPSGINLFSELFNQAQTLPGWRAARWTVDQTNALDADEVARLRREMPEQSYAREYLCDFTASGNDQIISLADVDAAAARAHNEWEIRSAPRVLGVDPARFGDDRSVIVQRQGLVMFPPLIMRGVDNMALADRVAAVIGSWQPDAVFIDAGAGAGVIDRLRQMGHRCVEVSFGGRAIKPHLFANRRTEMWMELRDWLLAGGAIPKDLALQQELATPIYWFDSAGRKVLEPKDEIKKRLPGAGSPDIADALALTFAAPVTPKEGLPGWGRQQTSHDEFGFGDGARRDAAPSRFDAFGDPL